MKAATKFITCLSIITMLILISSYAQKDGKKPELMGFGTEFWISNPPVFYEYENDRDLVKIFVASKFKTLVEVEIPAKNYRESKYTYPNNFDDVIVFDLLPEEGQVVVKDSEEDPIPEKVYKGYGIHIKSEKPIKVQCICRFAGSSTSDGYLVLPVSELGREYIVSAYKVDTMFKNVWDYKMPSQATITAAYDNTRVTFELGGNEYTQTAGGKKPGDIKQVTLNEGDVWMFQSKGGNSDLTGSRITANKPVSVIAGNQCANIPVGNQWCDHTVQMLLPTEQWGKQYHVAKLPDREYPSLIQVFAKEENTNIYRDGKQISFISESGGIEKKGFQEMRMHPLEESNHSVVISGDKPIGVNFLNTGTKEDGYPLPNSDPFIMPIIPYKHYYKEIFFNTPGTNTGDSYSENYLNFIFETDEQGYLSEDIQYAEYHNGEFHWVALRDSFQEPGEIFDYDVENKKFAVKTLTLPEVGIFKIKAEKPFAAYSFGFDWCDSYGYPADYGNEEITEPEDRMPPEAFIDNECGYYYGSFNDKPENSQISSGIKSIEFISEESNNLELSFDSFQEGTDEKVNWKLKPVDGQKSGRGVIRVSDMFSNEFDYIFDYTVPRYQIKPSYALILIADDAGIEYERKFEVHNNLGQPIMIEEFKLKNKREFSLDYPKDLPYKLERDGSINLNITFKPKAIGRYTDSIIVNDTCGIKAYFKILGECGLTQVSQLPEIENRTTISPNPANDNFSLSIEMHEPAEVTIFISDVQGRLVYVPFRNKYLSKGENKLNINSSRLRPGAYIVTIELLSGKVNKKLRVVR